MLSGPSPWPCASRPCCNVRGARSAAASFPTATAKSTCEGMLLLAESAETWPLVGWTERFVRKLRAIATAGPVRLFGASDERDSPHGGGLRGRGSGFFCDDERHPQTAPAAAAAETPRSVRAHRLFDEVGIAGHQRSSLALLCKWNRMLAVAVWRECFGINQC